VHRTEGSRSQQLIASIEAMLATFVRAMVILSIVVVLVFTVLQVLDRYLLKSSFDAHDQIARLGLVWLTFLGFAIAVRGKLNIRVEVLEHVFSSKSLRFLSPLLDLVVLGTALYLLSVGWRLLEIGSFQNIFGTPLTYSWIYAGLLAGLVCVVIFIAFRLLGIRSHETAASRHGQQL
jgi:TRAP-type C4-dicarboxylate transport system permease small subunit